MSGPSQVPRPLRVLLTNTYLVEHAGTELYIRDLALALLRRGHTPIVFSPRLGAVAAEIRAATVPVVDTLDSLGAPPDLIHGQHHLETMTALLHFPTVPAIFFSHGWQPWQEAPPHFPRIRRYVAVDHTVLDRLVHEHGIAPERVSVILNAVDLERFRPRPGLPDRPRRALLFGNAIDGPYRRAVAAACAQCGVALDFVGRDAGTPNARPEALLPEYDLVFAKARAAMEALATGAAVILASPDGVGPLVTPANFDRLRAYNFGIRTLDRPMLAEIIAAEIARYDAADAAAVSARMRCEGGLDLAVDSIVALYRRVLADYEPDARDLDAELRATAAYLRSLSKVYLDGLLDDRQRLIGAHAAALAARDDALRAADALGATHEEVVRQLRAAHGEEQRLRAAELAAARAEIDALRDEAVRAADALGATHGEEMQQLRAAHEEARATLAAELAMTRAEIGAMRRTRGWRALEVWWRAKRRLTGRS